MEPVELRCLNCGKTVKEEIMRSRYAIQGTVIDLNRKQECCQKPDYSAGKGAKSPKGTSLRQLLNRVAEATTPPV